MKPQSAQGWVHSVLRDYLHIGSLQVIDTNEGKTFKILPSTNLKG
ncbi:hypothetical protein [Shewanella benthica]|nr:hypothetical protein [Shewanella benthica]